MPKAAKSSRYCLRSSGPIQDDNLVTLPTTKDISPKSTHQSPIKQVTWRIPLAEMAEGSPLKVPKYHLKHCYCTHRCLGSHFICMPAAYSTSLWHDNFSPSYIGEPWWS